MISLIGYSLSQAQDAFDFPDGRRRNFRIQRGTAQVEIDGAIWHGTIMLTSTHGCSLTVDTPRGLVHVVAQDVFPGLSEVLTKEYAARKSPRHHQAQALRDTLDAIKSLQSVVRLLASEHWSATMAKRVDELNTRVALLRGTLEKIDGSSTVPPPSDPPGA